MHVWILTAASCVDYASSDFVYLNSSEKFLFFFPPSINAVASRAQIASCWGAGLRGQGAICTSHLQIRPIQKSNPIYTKMSNTVLKTLSNTKFNGKFRLLLRIALLAIKPSISTFLTFRMIPACLKYPILLE